MWDLWPSFIYNAAIDQQQCHRRAQGIGHCIVQVGCPAVVKKTLTDFHQ